MTDTTSNDGLYIHVGAHRTATSSFQGFIYENRAVLQAAGLNLAIASRDLNHHAPDVGMRLRLPNAKQLKTGDIEERQGWLNNIVAKKHLNEAPRSLISEENLIGSFQAIFARRLFDDARQRLAFFAAPLERPVRRVLLRVRSYDSFFASSYRRRCELRKIRPFSIYKHMILEAQRDWVDLAHDVQEALKPDELLIVPYEHQQSETDLLRQFVPDLEDVDLQPATERLNVSATDAACFAMQEAYARDPKPTHKDIKTIILKHADDRDGPAIAPYGEDERTALQDRYARDLDRLDQLPGVRLIR